MNLISYKSCAKVNLGLQIHNKRTDGYHNIHTVFHEIDFHDLITINKRNYGCEFSSNVKWLKNDNTNLCVKAWEIMVQKYGIDGIDINVEKNIPRGGGLGGGSSNAASILKAINILYKLGIKHDELIRLARGLGADVPFFINGGLQAGDGIGDKLTVLKRDCDWLYLIIMPDLKIDTNWAYKEMRYFLDSPRKKTKFASFIQKKNIPFDVFENDFETIVFPAYPEIGLIKDKLRDYGARFASLSGSGSTVYGIFDEDADINSAESYFSSQYKTIISRPNF